MDTPIEAVIFDWGGTLTPWHTVDVRASWASIHTDPGVIDRLYAAEVEVWNRSRDHHRSATLAEVLDAAGVVPTAAALRRYDRWWDPHTYTDPQAAPMLRGLRERGLRVGVLSNTLWTRDRHETIFARDGILDLVDGAVYTSEIAWTKPHPQAFRAALDAVGVDDPARAIFVGDRPFDDIHGARTAGLRTVLVPHSTIPVDQRGHTDGEPDAVIGELAELIAVVDRWRR